MKKILIVPNSASRFAISTKYGNAGPRIDKFIEDLSKKLNVRYLVLPGQGTDNGKYSYTGSVNFTENAIKEFKPDGIIGMCTGTAIAVEAMARYGMEKFPIIAYNTPEEVGWGNERMQIAFRNKYGDLNRDKSRRAVALDCEELLLNAPPCLSTIIQKHQGEILQIIGGNSDYLAENQRQLSFKIPRIKTVEFMTMSDAPIGESEEYPLLIQTIFDFFK